MYEGDQVVEAYSRIGRTYILNARIRLEELLERKLRLMSADLWLAFETILLRCCLKRKSASTITPRSVTEPTTAIILLSIL